MPGLRQSVPWWLRIVVKVVLARLPIPYAFWKSLRLFELGDMDQPQRALDTFLEHAETAHVLDTKSDLPRLMIGAGDFGVLELGPGDALFAAVIARSLGASRTWLVDAGPFATTDMAAYVRLFDLLRRNGLVLPFENDPLALAEVLKNCNAQYLPEGVRSLALVPSASVDFCFSNAVLEHIPRGDFAKLADELFRITKPGGVAVHRVDMKDHLGGALNNLRFSEAIWESALFRNSGFYTNRIRLGEMVAHFEQAGYECTIPRVVRWVRLPTPRAKMDPAFRELRDAELLVSGFDIVMHRRG